VPLYVLFFANIMHADVISLIVHVAYWKVTSISIRYQHRLL